jgi:CheY-like chemotaxis protein
VDVVGTFADSEAFMRVVLLSKSPDLALIRALREAGHDLWHTVPGEQAYRNTRDAFPTAVLIDLSADAIKGLAAAEALAANARTRSIPVILFNAENVASARSKAPYVRALLSAPSRHADLLRALSAFEVDDGA